MDISTFNLRQFPQCSLTILQKNAFLDAGDVLFTGKRKGITGFSEHTIAWVEEGTVLPHRTVYSASDVLGWEKVFSLDFPSSIGKEWSFHLAKEGLVHLVIGQWTEYGKSLRGKRIGFLPMGSRDENQIAEIMVTAISDVARMLTPSNGLEYPRDWYTETNLFLYTLSDSADLEKAFKGSDAWSPKAHD